MKIHPVRQILPRLEDQEFSVLAGEVPKNAEDATRKMSILHTGVVKVFEFQSQMFGAENKLGNECKTSDTIRN